MTKKEWTPDEVRDLIQLAKERGISQKDLASEYIGIHQVTLSQWTKEGSGKEPSDLAKNALNYAELRVKKTKVR